MPETRLFCSKLEDCNIEVTEVVERLTYVTTTTCEENSSIVEVIDEVEITTGGGLTDEDGE